MRLGVYVHVPFCDRICVYCDFAKEVANDTKKAQYLDALEEEMAYYQDFFKHARTLYVGGGTPTALPYPLLERLLQHLSSRLPMDALEEFTIEANPNDVTQEIAQLFKRYGVNRVSLGVQTFANHHLNFLNRTHQAQDVKLAVQILRDAGINNLNLDMMFALPNQTLTELKDDLEQLTQFDVNHVSYYSLILEEKTPLYLKVAQGEVLMPDEQEEGLYFQTVIETLKAAGYEHYEISNFAKPSAQSKHNRIYWENHPYVGLGPSAHGRLGNTRYGNVRSIKKYITSVQSVGHAQAEQYAFNDVEDTLLMGLRLREGVHVQTLEARIGGSLYERYPKLTTFVEQGLLKEENGHLSFTDQGLFLGNVVFSEFIGDGDD